MMNQLVNERKIQSYHIYVIEQNQSQKKFNRGLLLNIGANFARQSYETLIFHDVDLLPGNDLSEWYSLLEKREPIHIAACWKNRYGYNKEYFGGIVSFNRDVYKKVNGFPNNFWGWGGEDDVLHNRCVKGGLCIRKVRDGTLTDIETNDKGEEMDLDKKLKFLRENREWKCNDRWERKDQDKWIWKTNGIQQIRGKYEMSSFETVGDTTQIEVIV